MTPVTKHEQYKYNVRTGIRSSNRAWDACGVRGNTRIELFQSTWTDVLHDPRWSEGTTQNTPSDFFTCIIHVYAIEVASSNHQKVVVNDPNTHMPRLGARAPPKHLHTTTCNTRSKKNTPVKISVCTLCHAYIEGGGSNPESGVVNGTVGGFSHGG
jgi:hypothetical protein